MRREVVLKRSPYELSELVSDLPVFTTEFEIIAESIEAGAWAFVCRDERLLSRVCAYFGQPMNGAIVKIWHYPFPDNNLSSVNWGRYFNMREADFIDVNSFGALLPALKAQNFAAKSGLAPAVFGLFAIESGSGTLHPAILCQDAKALGADSSTEEVEKFEKIQELCEQHGVVAPFLDLQRGTNFVNGLYVDWQYSSLSEKHLEFLREYYLEHTQFGESKYQTAPSIGVDIGIRDTVKRIADLGLDRIEFRGLSVLDIGCNGGQFLNYAAAKGARYCYGVDWPNVARAADYVSSYLGHFNINYMGAALHEDLPEQVSREPYDVVLMLSMTTHIGTPDYLHGLGKRLILEVNHPHQVIEVEQALEPHWWFKEFGKAGDHGDRAIYHCYSKRYYSGYAGLE